MFKIEMSFTVTPSAIFKNGLKIDLYEGSYINYVDSCWEGRGTGVAK